MAKSWGFSILSPWKYTQMMLESYHNTLKQYGEKLIWPLIIGVIMMKLDFLAISNIHVRYYSIGKFRKVYVQMANFHRLTPLEIDKFWAKNWNFFRRIIYLMCMLGMVKNEGFSMVTPLYTAQINLKNIS